MEDKEQIREYPRMNSHLHTAASANGAVVKIQVFNFASRYSTSAVSNDTFKLTVIKSSEMLRLINPLYALQTISYYHASSRFDVFPITSDNEDGRTSNEEIQTVFDTTFTCDWTQLSHKESRIEISLQ